MGKNQLIVVENEVTLKEQHATIERLAGDLEKHLISWNNNLFNPKVELLNIVGQWTIHRQMLVDMLSAMQVTIELSSYTPVNPNQAAIQHIFGATRIPNSEVLRQGVVHAITTFNRLKSQLSTMQKAMDEITATNSVTNSSFKTLNDKFKELQREYVDLEKKHKSSQAKVTNLEDEQSRSIIIKNDGPYFLVNSNPKARGVFIGTNAPLKTIPPDGKLVVPFKVGALIRTKEIVKAVRFMEQEHAHHFLEYVKKWQEKLNENNGLKASLIKNYVIGLQAINY